MPSSLSASPSSPSACSPRVREGAGALSSLPLWGGTDGEAVRVGKSETHAVADAVHFPTLDASRPVPPHKGEGGSDAVGLSILTPAAPGVAAGFAGFGVEAQCGVAQVRGIPHPGSPTITTHAPSIGVLTGVFNASGAKRRRSSMSATTRARDSQKSIAWLGPAARSD